MERIECVVVGAGVIGLAAASRLAQAGREVIVLEQHGLIGSETSSRNSEVIHAGIYYPTNSLKAKLCVEGKQRLYAHCEEYAVPFKRCGKIIVAGTDAQRPTVEGYVQQARANGVSDLAWLTAEQIYELEPLVESVGGVLSPSTGIIDSHAYMLSLQGLLEAHDGMVVLNSHLEHARQTSSGIVIETDGHDFVVDHLINCAGFDAPRIANTFSGDYQSYFAKGHYYTYSGAPPFSRLVYPVAEAGGLGVHVTLDMAGQVKFGPDVRWIDELNYDFDESHLDEFIRAIRAYFPTVDAARLMPSYTGIRPKLAPAGGGFQDFVIETEVHHGTSGLVNLLGIESPGLTASLAIAERVLQVVDA